MSVQILCAIILCALALLLLRRARRGGSSGPLLAGLTAIAAASVGLRIFTGSSSSAEAEEKRCLQAVELSQQLPLAQLSKKLGGHGKIAVLVNRSDFDGQTSEQSAARVAQWQQSWPQHSFVIVASRSDAWPATLSRLAEDPGLAAIVILEALPPEALDAGFLGDEVPSFPQAVLCLDPGSTERLLPRIRDGSIFAGLRSRSRTFLSEPKDGPQELFDRNFVLVDQRSLAAEAPVNAAAQDADPL